MKKVWVKIFLILMLMWIFIAIFTFFWTRISWNIHHNIPFWDIDYSQLFSKDYLIFSFKMIALYTVLMFVTVYLVHRLSKKKNWR
ncbi:hypothetical protein A6A10_05205 [Otariodibacter oris]|uniref:Uncharacterized protein n=1 Tax=Otariodibacter oris TaxID=1032623 RepID=A0A420XI02_9PAST|nr:hypothetical protein A6A10_05205 [Otariodibacter oris]RKR76987.1 hypothetical protein DES31_0300 [Otariodibacter oris]